MFVWKFIFSLRLFGCSLRKLGWRLATDIGVESLIRELDARLDFIDRLFFYSFWSLTQLRWWIFWESGCLFKLALGLAKSGPIFKFFVGANIRYWNCIAFLESDSTRHLEAEVRLLICLWRRSSFILFGDWSHILIRLWKVIVSHQVLSGLWVEADGLFAALESAELPGIVGTDLAVLVLVLQRANETFVEVCAGAGYFLLFCDWPN